MPDRHNKSIAPDPFGSTRWSIVLAAAGDGINARAALEKLCESYWPPVYGFVRSRTSNTDDAYDLTQHSRHTALKRGGGRTISSLDRDVAESRLPGLHAAARTPEQEFERRWTLALLDQVLERLKTEQTIVGRGMEFSVLLPLLTGQPETMIHSSAARALGTTPAAIRAAVYRLRKRYRALLRDEIAHTVGAAEAVAEELQHLIAVVSF